MGEKTFVNTEFNIFWTKFIAKIRESYIKNIFSSGGYSQIRENRIRLTEFDKTR